MFGTDGVRGVANVEPIGPHEAQQVLATARGHRIERAEVMPTLSNNIVWRALYEHENRVFSDRIRVGWFSDATVREGWSLPLVDLGDLSSAESARNQHESFERFAWFSDEWVARSPADSSVLADMRYSLSAEAFDPIWGIRFTPTGQPGVYEVMGEYGMAGSWQITLEWGGPAGRGSATFVGDVQ